MSKTPHTGCWPGKRVRVVLTDGTAHLDRFLDATKSHIVLETLGRVKKSLVKSFTIWKKKTL